MLSSQNQYVEVLTPNVMGSILIKVKWDYKDKTDGFTKTVEFLCLNHYPFMTYIQMNSMLASISIMAFLMLFIILDINPLSGTQVVNIFPQSVFCFFILLLITFAMQKLQSLL